MDRGRNFQARINRRYDGYLELAALMASIVAAATPDQKLKLLRAHPELVGKLAIANKLTSESQSEQAGAGLDQCTAEEFKKFQTLNADYSAKFGFPFIIAVKGLNRNEILTAFEMRIANDRSTEFETALNEVHKIARLRIQSLIQPE